MSWLFGLLDAATQRTYQVLSAAGFCFAGFGLYLQHGLGINPCPMCIVQRYALIGVALIALVAGFSKQKAVHLTAAALLMLTAAFGAFVAARQSWLQWYPPEVATCGRDFYGMIESFPLQRAIPMIFKGSGDCSAIDWSFLGASLANWSFVTFSAITLLAALILWRRGFLRR